MCCLPLMCIYSCPVYVLQVHVTVGSCDEYYRQISNIRRTKSQTLNVSQLVLQLSLPNPLKSGYQDENEDVVGAAPAGDAPTTSEWSTILLLCCVRLMLEVLR